MPIDPSINNNLQPIKLEDPMTRYANMLAVKSAMNQSDEYDNKVATRNALNAVMQKALKPDGTYDRSLVRTGLIGSGYGSSLPDVEKGFAEMDDKIAGVKKTEAETRNTEANIVKTKAETVAKKLDSFFNRQWGANLTPQQALQLNDALYTDPDTASFFTSMGGSREKGAAEIRQAAANPAAWTTYLTNRRKQAMDIKDVLASHVEKVDRGNKVDLVQVSDHGFEGPKTVGSYSVAESPNAPRTTIVNVPQKVESEGGKKFGELEATDLHEMLKNARSAPQLASEADRALDLLEAGKVFTGKMANVKLEVARTLKAMGVPVEGVEDSQTLAALLAKKTLSAIQTSGVGARGVDTPKEREFLEKAENAQLTLDKETLVTAAKLMRKAANYSIQRFNENAKFAPDSWFAGSGVRRELPLILERKAQGSPKAPSNAGGWTLNGKTLKVGDVVNGHRYKGGNPKDGTSWE